MIPGHLSFGQGFTGRGLPVVFNPAPGQMPDNRRPQSDIVRGPHGEPLSVQRVESLEIRIVPGRDGNRYSWVQVHPTPQGTTPNQAGGSTFDGFPAVEMGGRRDVPVGTVVTAFYSEVSPCLVFSYQGLGGSGVSGPGGLRTVKWAYYTKIGSTCYFVQAALTTGPDGSMTISFDLSYSGDGP